MLTRMFITMWMEENKVNLTKDPTTGKWFKKKMHGLALLWNILRFKKSKEQIYVLSYNPLSGIWLN